MSALGDADFVLNHYSHVRCSEILLELASARIFDSEHDDIEDFAQAVVSSSLVTKPILAFRAAHIQDGDPFDQGTI